MLMESYIDFFENVFLRLINLCQQIRPAHKALCSGASQTAFQSQVIVGRKTGTNLPKSKLPELDP
jgi:hypothetical protein